MKKILILIMLSGNAYAATDYTCQNRCLNMGYTYGYCQSACSYDSGFSNTIKQTDYTCMNRCTNSGYLYNYCKSACSY